MSCGSQRKDSIQIFDVTIPGVRLPKWILDEGPSVVQEFSLLKQLGQNIKLKCGHTFSDTTEVARVFQSSVVRSRKYMF